MFIESPFESALLVGDTHHLIKSRISQTTVIASVVYLIMYEINLKLLLLRLTEYICLIYGVWTRSQSLNMK